MNKSPSYNPVQPKIEIRTGPSTTTTYTNSNIVRIEKVINQVSPGYGVAYAKVFLHGIDNGTLIDTSAIDVPAIIANFKKSWWVISVPERTLDAVYTADTVTSLPATEPTTSAGTDVIIFSGQPYSMSYEYTQVGVELSVILSDMLGFMVKEIPGFAIEKVIGAATGRLIYPPDAFNKRTPAGTIGNRATGTSVTVPHPNSTVAYANLAFGVPVEGETLFIWSVDEIANWVKNYINYFIQLNYKFGITLNFTNSSSFGSAKKSPVVACAGNSLLAILDGAANRKDGLAFVVEYPSSNVIELRLVDYMTGSTTFDFTAAAGRPSKYTTTPVVSEWDGAKSSRWLKVVTKPCSVIGSFVAEDGLALLQKNWQVPPTGLADALAAAGAADTDALSNVYTVFQPNLNNVLGNGYSHKLAIDITFDTSAELNFTTNNLTAIENLTFGNEIPLVISSATSATYSPMHSIETSILRYDDVTFVPYENMRVSVRGNQIKLQQSGNQALFSDATERASLVVTGIIHGLKPLEYNTASDYLGVVTEDMHTYKIYEIDFTPVILLPGTVFYWSDNGTDKKCLPAGPALNYDGDLKLINRQLDELYDYMTKIVDYFKNDKTSVESSSNVLWHEALIGKKLVNLEVMDVVTTTRNNWKNITSNSLVTRQEYDFSKQEMRFATQYYDLLEGR